MPPHAEEAPRRRLRVLVADDHPALRTGLRAALEQCADVAIAGEAVSLEDLLCQASALVPAAVDLVLVDASLPPLGGLEATRQLVAQHPDLAVVVLNDSSAEDDLLHAVQAGAIGYLGRAQAPEALLRALGDYHREGVLPLPARAVRLFRAAYQPDPMAGVLSEREEAVLHLVATGARDREIAERMGLSEGTVKKHLQRILRKLSARNRTEAVMRRRGLTPPGAPPSA